MYHENRVSCRGALDNSKKKKPVWTVSGEYDFPMEEGPRRRLADSAVDRPQGPAVTFMPRRLRALAAQSLGRCTPFAASAVSTGVA